MEIITQRQMRNDSAVILRRVAAGESFVISNRGVHVARLVPIERRDNAERDALVTDGVLLDRRLRVTPLPTPVTSDVDVAALLDEDRSR